MDVKSILSASRKLVDELDQYRQPWESKGHWHARKTFLRYHWEKFLDKDRLICLSSVWFNVHFMGNKYPTKLMDQLHEMEDGFPSARELLSEC